MVETLQNSVNALPMAESCRLLPVESASVRPGIANGTHFLMVSGTKPYAAMKVRIMPLIYVRRPEWWGIEIVGCLEDGIVTDQTGTYSEQKEIWFWGTKGIEVIGKDYKQRFELPQP